MMSISRAAGPIIIGTAMVLSTNACGQEPIYRTGSYTLYPSKVVQGRLEASVDSTAHTVGPDIAKKISDYPSYRSHQPIVDALMTKALGEVLLDIRPDGAFMAGAKWEGIWTRDVSYSILLSLAFLDPEAAKASLRAKVHNDRIVQDTGTGGSWPVSTDRMVWTLAAWEVYRVTGDREWLRYAYDVTKKSAADDGRVVIDPATGLCCGESSFLDWREQTYPRWMDPKDIFQSHTLGTNAVHYRAYRILADMATLCGDDPSGYESRAEKIKTEMNRRLWIEEKGFYGQYLYGRIFQTLSSKSEALGEALAVLFDVAESDRASRVIASTPALEFGTPTIFPQIPNIPPYHNNSIWPFVQAYWAWASAHAGNMASVEHSLASIYRAAALFNTNKENIEATTGDAAGTQINSDRQLWSAAGCLATVYRVLFGMKFTEEGLSFEPCIPDSYPGDKSISNFKYRDALLSIHCTGTGTSVASAALDGVQIARAFIPSNILGTHTLDIVLSNAKQHRASINRVANAYAPDTPIAKYAGGKLSWKAVPGAAGYHLYVNGRKIAARKTTSYGLAPGTGMTLAQVLAVDSGGHESFLSAPVLVGDTKSILISYAGTTGAPLLKDVKGFSSRGYVRTSPDENPDVVFSLDAPREGAYAIDVRYANGNGPVDTGIDCAVRIEFLNDMPLGPVVMPQRGDRRWNDWGFSSSLVGRLKKGFNTCRLSLPPSPKSANGSKNTALLDYVRFIPLPEK